MKSTFIFRFLSVNIGLLVGIIIAEVVVRMLGVSSELAYRPNPFFGWSHTPNHSFVWKHAEFENNISINSLGLRDYEYQYKKPDGVFRILVLGDSYMEALQVPLEASFTKLLENVLNSPKVVNNYSKVQVINTGTSGYGTDNELLFYRHEGYRYSPDLVILAIYLGNDVRNNWYKLENLDAGGTRKPYFDLNSYEGLQLKNYPFKHASSSIVKLKAFLNTHVRLYTFLKRMRDRFRHSETVATTGFPLDLNLFNATHSEDWDHAWRITEALVEKLAKELASSGVQLFVMLIPTQFQVHKSYWENNIIAYPALRESVWDLDRPNRLLKEYLELKAIRYVDLLTAFQKLEPKSGEELYLVADGHWNTKGHELASTTVAKSLIDQKLLRDNYKEGRNSDLVSTQIGYPLANDD